MPKNWMRMINAAQRVVTINAPKTANMPGLKTLWLDIQGVRVDWGGYDEFWPYLDMAEMGVRRDWAKPLGLWQRLRREQTPIGWVEQCENSQHFKLSFWSPTPLTLDFDLDQEADGILWRESEIMVMSAGFYFMPRQTA